MNIEGIERKTKFNKKQYMLNKILESEPNDMNTIKVILDYWFEGGKNLPNRQIYPLFIKYFSFCDNELDELLCYVDIFKEVENLENFSIGDFEWKDIPFLTIEEFKEFIFQEKINILSIDNRSIEDKRNIYEFYCQLNRTDKILCNWFCLKSNNTNMFIEAMNNLNNYCGFSQIIIKQLLGIKWSNLPNKRWVWNVVYGFYEFLSTNPDELLAIASATVIYINLKYRIINQLTVGTVNGFINEYNKNPTFRNMGRSLIPFVSNMRNSDLNQKEKKRINFLIEYIESN